MEIYHVELTSQCNLKCSYCPQPTMVRRKEHMPIELFGHILNFPIWYNFILGHLFGEAFLHPNLLEIIDLANERGKLFGFSTNALSMSPERLKEVIERGLGWMVISNHIPIAGKWYQYIRDQYPDFPVLFRKMENKHDWGGQIEEKKSKDLRKTMNSFAPDQPDLKDCIYHYFNLASISAQGEILACSVDAEGESSMGNIKDFTPEQFAALKNDKVFSLCKNCPLNISVKELEEYELRTYLRAEEVSNYLGNKLNSKFG